MSNTARCKPADGRLLPFPVPDLSETDYVSDVARFPEWPTSFCLSVRQADGEWLMETPDGPATIRFVERND